VKRIIIINGPNLNLLGTREPEVYGNQSFENYLQSLKEKFPAEQLEYFQNNVEGEIINKLHEAGMDAHGIIINPGGYSHTSVAIADAIEAIKTPVVEVHISNVHAREDFRQVLLTARNCRGVISGLGLMGYEAAIRYLLKNYE